MYWWSGAGGPALVWRGEEIGEYILPPSVTDVPQNGDVSPDIRRNDRIYMVKLFDQAAIWAAHHEYPRIYEVEVECVVEDDPDVPGTAFQCEKHASSTSTRFRRKCFWPRGKGCFCDRTACYDPYEKSARVTADW